MSTFGTMQARIGEETRRPELLAETQAAIVDAIRLYETQSFWFNGVREGASVLQEDDGSTLTTEDGSPLQVDDALRTVPGQEFYTDQDYGAIGLMPHITKIVLQAFGTVRYALRPQTSNWMDDHSVSTSWRGMPTDYNWSAGALRLYPIPNGVYPLTIVGTGTFVSPANDADTSPWFVEGERLIRCAAKRILYAETIRDPDMAMMERQNEIEVFEALKRASARRGASARVRVRSWF
jgi:hypothetical protein